MKLPNLLNVMLGLTLAVLVVNASLSYSNIQDLVARQSWVTHTHEVLWELETAISLLKDAESGARGYAVTGDTAFLNYARLSERQAEGHFRNLRILIRSDPDQLSRIAELDPLVSREYDTMRRIIAAREAQGFEAAKSIIASGEGRRQMLEIRNQVDAFRRVESARLQQREAGSQARFQHVVAADLIAAVVGMAMVCILFAVIRTYLADRARAEKSSRFLSDASASLAALIDYESTLDRIARLAVPAFADWCAVDMRDAQGSMRRLAIAHVDPAKVELGYEIDRRFPPAADAPRGPCRVLKTGKPELEPRLSEQVLQAVANDSEHLQMLRQLGLSSYMCVPLVIRGETQGVLSFATAESGKSFTENDLLIAQDLSLRAAIAIENARLYNEARAADRRKDEFLAMLAHELRNPLAPLRSGMALLGAGHVDRPTIDLMERQVDHMARLVDDLLDVSRIMRGKVELRRTPVELSTVVGRAVETVRNLIQSQRHELIVALPDRPVWIDADTIRLAQILSNLLSNAAKYTEPGGHIRLTAESEEGGVIISVRDDGIGIDADLLPHVFDLFTQADRSIERSQGGLGVGLTLVRSLVEMHDGSISASSSGLGQGSEFVVRLPAAARTLEVPAAASGSPSTRPLRILVVDDNMGAATILARMLRKFWGHEVEEAHDGIAAVEAARRFDPMLILLDIGLPGLNGYEVARLLRKTPAFQSTLLVALTGYGQDEDRRRSREAGFDEHLVKPVSVAMLEEIFAHPRLAVSHTSHEQA